MGHCPIWPGSYSICKCIVMVYLQKPGQMGRCPVFIFYFYLSELHQVPPAAYVHRYIHIVYSNHSLFAKTWPNGTVSQFLLYARIQMVNIYQTHVEAGKRRVEMRPI